MHLFAGRARSPKPHPPLQARCHSSDGDGANFLLFRCHTGGHAVWQALVDAGVLVRDFSSWPGVDDCLRVTVGTVEENDRFLAGLRSYLARK